MVNPKSKRQQEEPGAKNQREILAAPFPTFHLSSSQAVQTPDTHVLSSVNFRKFLEIVVQSTRTGGGGNGKVREGGSSAPW